MIKISLKYNQNTAIYITNQACIHQIIFSMLGWLNRLKIDSDRALPFILVFALAVHVFMGLSIVYSAPNNIIQPTMCKDAGDGSTELADRGDDSSGKCSRSLCLYCACGILSTVAVFIFIIFSWLSSAFPL